MNKEQKKPQELSSATKPRRICYLCEEKLPCEHYPQQAQEEALEEKEWTHDFMSFAYNCELDPNQTHAIDLYIRAYFIAKRDLRKLLEGKKRVMAHIVGSKRIETPYVTIDDILAEIEKL